MFKEETPNMRYNVTDTNKTTLCSDRAPQILSEKYGGKQAETALKYGMIESVHNEETALFDVLPGVGKTKLTPEVVKKLGVRAVVLTNLRENYDQLKDFADQAGKPAKKLPTVHQCPVLKEDNDGNYVNRYDDPIAQQAREAYAKNWIPSQIHDSLEMPCQEDGTCEYSHRLDEIDPDGWDLLIGNYVQAHNLPYTKDRVVFIDEQAFQDFVNDIGNPKKRANAFLSTIDALPLDAVPTQPTQDEIDETLHLLEEKGLEPSDYSGNLGDFDSRAPKIAYGLLASTRWDNGLNVAELPGNGTVVFGDKNEDTFKLFDPPEFGEAEAVIGLDATPSIRDWERIIGKDLEHYRLFDAAGRNRYLRDDGNQFIQLHNHVWPANGGSPSIDKCEAFLRAIKQEHGVRPDLIASQATLGEKDDKEGLKDRGLDHLWNQNLHYGDLRGKNDLRDSELLVVLGSPSRSDDYYQEHAAFFDGCAEPATDKEGNRANGHALDYQNEAANEHLNAVRRGGVFQAAMRAGRTDGTEATIYIATGMVPEWLETKKAGQTSNGSFDACTHLRSKGEREVIEAMRGEKGISTSEIVEKVNIGREMVKKHRKALQDRGLIQKDGEKRGARYTDVDLDAINIAGSVDLSLSGNDPYYNPRRGDYPIESIDMTPPKREGVSMPPAWQRALWWATKEKRQQELLKQRDYQHQRSRAQGRLEAT